MSSVVFDTLQLLDSLWWGDVVGNCGSNESALFSIRGHPETAERVAEELLRAALDQDFYRSHVSRRQLTSPIENCQERCNEVVVALCKLMALESPGLDVSYQFSEHFSN